MDLLIHLADLRRRLLLSLSGVVVVFLALLPFSPQIYAFVTLPLLSRLPPGGRLIATDVASPFFVPLKLVLCVALVLSAPWILLQAWRFAAPGLLGVEKRLIRWLSVSSLVLFYAGITFSYCVVMPAAFALFARVAPSSIVLSPDMSRHLDFVLGMSLAFGFCFELPVVIVALALSGTVSVSQLRAFRGYAAVGIFAIAAVVTPPDVLSQFLLALPLLALYEIGVLVASRIKGSV